MVVSQSAPPNPFTQRIVLLGATSAHLRFLAALAARPLPDTQVTLVAAQQHTLPGPLLPVFIAGHTSLDDCTIALKPLVDRSGAHWIQHGIAQVDTSTQTVQLSDGSTLAYDWLSIANGPTCNRQQVECALPGAREHALFVHPVEPFAALWRQVADLGDHRPLRLAVTGSSAQAIELALAVRHRLPQTAVTLLCGAELPGMHFPSPVRQQLLAALKNRGITVLQDHALAIHADRVELGCGANLACDVVLLTDRAESPAWLTNSGLSLGDHQAMSVDTHLRSTSHGQVFGMPSADQASLFTEALLARNLQAALTGQPLRTNRPWATPFHLLSCGNRSAIATWGHYSTEGRWVWWLKNWTDRRRIAAYAIAPKY